MLNIVAFYQNFVKNIDLILLRAFGWTGKQGDDKRPRLSSAPCLRKKDLSSAMHKEAGRRDFRGSGSGDVIGRFGVIRRARLSSRGN